MKIVQVFKSAQDEQTISEIEIAEAANVAPLVGDSVHWIANGKVYAGRVISRLISYSPQVSVAREDDFDVTAILTVDLSNS